MNSVPPDAVPDDGNKLVSHTEQLVRNAQQGVKPDPEIVDSLMSTFETDIANPNRKEWSHAYSDFLYRHSAPQVRVPENGQFKYANENPGALPDTLFSVLMNRRDEAYVPPSRIQEKDYVSGNTRTYWTEFAKMVTDEAQRRSLRMPGGLDELRKLESNAIRNINVVYRDSDPNYLILPLHFQADTTAPKTGEAIKDEITGVINAAKRELRKGIESVLSDVKFIDDRRKAFEVRHWVDSTVILRETVDKINFLRAQAEDPVEAERFLDILRQIVELMGYTDLDVELLSTKDAMTRHCIGLYTPAQGGQRAKISIPMSIYGTDELVPLKTTLDTVAHEVAHHDMAVMGKNVQMTDHPVHGFTHDALTARREEEAVKLSIVPEQNADGTIGLKVIRDIAKDPLMQHTSLIQVMRDEMAKLAPVAQKQLEETPQQSTSVQTSTGMSVADRTRLASSVAAEVAGQLGPMVNTAVKSAIAGKSVQAPAAPKKGPWWKFGLGKKDDNPQVRF